MSEFIFIGNPKAGQGRSQELIEQAKTKFTSYPCRFYSPRNFSELRSITESFESRPPSGVFIVGGDGTMNRLLPFLIDSKIPLGVVPAGTAGDLASELGHCSDLSWIESQMDSRFKSHREIDLIKINGRPFATAGGIGIGAILTQEYNDKRELSSNFKKMSQVLKSQVYTYLSAKTTLFRKDYIHYLSYDSDVYRGQLDTAALFITNQSRLGSDLTIAPSANNSDGVFNVLVIKGTNKINLLQSLARIKTGKFPKEFIKFETSRLVVESRNEKQISVFGDGEVLTQATRLVFEIAPKALCVFEGRKQ